MLQHINFARGTFVVASSLMTTFSLMLLPGFAQVTLEEASVPPTALQTAPQIGKQTEEQSATQSEPAVLVDDSMAQPTDPVAGREAAMQELVEALSLDGVALEPASTPLLEMLRADALGEHPEPPQAPGASALSGLSSVSSASMFQIEATETDLAAVSASFQVDRVSVPALRIALHSDNPRTQLYAADALWTLTGDAELILPTLMSVANSEEIEVRELALLALSHLGNEALPAVPLLDALTGDRNSRTRRIAEDALAVVRSENRPATALGIIARETGRLVGMPGLFEALSGLWR